MEENRIYYYGIDVAKLIAAIFVIGIHTLYIEEARPGVELFFVFIVKVICRLAVPIFFLSSSFFLFKNVSEQRLIKYISRIFKLYIIWNVILFPLTTVPYSPDRWLAKYLQLKWFFVDGTFFTSWFLLASIYCAYIANKIKNIYLLISIGVILYILSIYNSSYFNCPNIFTDNFDFGLQIKIPNTICSGLLFFGLGKYFAVKQDLLLYYCKRFSLHISCLVCVSLLLNFLECYYCVVNEYNHGLDSFFSLPVSATLVFLFLLRFHGCTKSKLCIQCRHISTLFYFVQFAPTLLMFLLYSTDYMFLNFLLVTIITTIISLFIYICSNRIKCLKVLY